MKKIQNAIHHWLNLRFHLVGRTLILDVYNTVQFCIWYSLLEKDNRFHSMVFILISILKPLCVGTFSALLFKVIYRFFGKYNLLSCTVLLYECFKYQLLSNLLCLNNRYKCIYLWFCIILRDMKRQWLKEYNNIFFLGCGRLVSHFLTFPQLMEVNFIWRNNIGFLIAKV